MEDLESYLESNLVTVRWLANTLQISSGEAEALMDKAKSAKPAVLEASYVVTGVKKASGGIAFLFVSEGQLEGCKAEFSNVTACHIFSLQKRADKANALSTGALAVQVLGTDSSQASELLFGTHPNSDTFLKNDPLGRIKRSSKIDIKPVGQRHLLAQALRAAEAPAKREAVSNAQHMANTFSARDAANKAKNDARATAFFANSSSSSSSSSSAAAAAAAGGGASKPPAAKAASSSIFAKKDADKDKTKDKTSPKAAPAAAAAAAAPRAPLVAPSSNDDGEWDDGSGYRPDAEKLKSRKAAFGMPQGTGGLHAEAAEGDEDGGEDGDGGAGGGKGKGGAGSDDEGIAAIASPKGGGKRAKRSTPVKGPVHGAMDDFFEESAAAAAAAAGAGADGVPGLGSPKGKRKRTKMVEKTFLDAKGFLVTEMVAEEVTDDERSPPPKASGAGARAGAGAGAGAGAQKPATKKAKEGDEDGDKPKAGAAAKPKAGGKAGGKDKEGGPPQKNMMSFFTKK